MYSGGGRERITLVVSPHARAALRRLAAFHGVSQAAMLERLASMAEGELTQPMGVAEQSAYYDMHANTRDKVEIVAKVFG